MTFTQPLPSSGLAHGSATSGISRSSSGNSNLRPFERHVSELFELREHVAAPPLHLFQLRRDGRLFLGGRRRQPLLEFRGGAGQGLGRFRVHGDGGVAQHRLRTRRGDRHAGRFARARVNHRILNVPEVSFDRFVKHFVVAHGRLQERVPVHEPFAAVDPLFLEQVEKRPPDRGHTFHRA